MTRDSGNSSDGLFDRTGSTLLDALPRGMHEHVKPLLSESPLEVAALARAITVHSAEIQSEAPVSEFLDLDTGLKVAARCRELLSGITSSTSSEHRLLIQVAARYFILEDDAEGDTTSLVGFDDDALVVDTVAKIIGRTDLPPLLD